MALVKCATFEFSRRYWRKAYYDHYASFDGEFQDIFAAETDEARHDCPKKLANRLGSGPIPEVAKFLFRIFLGFAVGGLVSTTPKGQKKTRSPE